MARRIAALSGALAALLAAPAFAGEMWVTIDSPRPHKLVEGVGTVMVTNPAVADVEVVSASEMLVFGRMAGVTDVIFYDEDGKRMASTRVRVRSDRASVVTLQAGATRYSFSCTDLCEQTPMPGDGGLVDGQALYGMAQTRETQAGRGLTLRRSEVDVSMPKAVEPEVEPAREEPSAES